MSNSDNLAALEDIKTPITTMTLRSNSKLLFDLYIKISDKYLHYIRAGDVIDEKRLERFKVKKVKKCFIRKQDESLYLSYLDESISLLDSTSVKVEDKASISAGVLHQAATDPTDIVQNEFNYKQTEDKVSKVVDFLAKDNASLKGLLGGLGRSQTVADHSMAVSSLALSVGLEFGITSHTDISNISMAALLHDIGHLEGSEDDGTGGFKDDPKHTENGYALVKGKSYIPDLVQEMVRDHEELMSGHGYPEKKELMSLGTSFQILNLCNAFDRFARQSGKDHKEAFKSFFLDFQTKLNTQHLQTLSKIIK